MRFHNSLFKIDDFTLSVLTMCLYLIRLCHSVKSKSGKVRKMSGNFFYQICVGTLDAVTWC